MKCKFCKRTLHPKKEYIYDLDVDGKYCKKCYFKLRDTEETTIRLMQKDPQSELQKELEESFERLNIIAVKMTRQIDLMLKQIELQATQIMCAEQIMERMRPMNEDEAEEYLTKNKS